MFLNEYSAPQTALGIALFYVSLSVFLNLSRTAPASLSLIVSMNLIHKFAYLRGQLINNYKQCVLQTRDQFGMERYIISQPVSIIMLEKQMDHLLPNSTISHSPGWPSFILNFDNFPSSFFGRHVIKTVGVIQPDLNAAHSPSRFSRGKLSICLTHLLKSRGRQYDWLWQAHADTQTYTFKRAQYCCTDSVWYLT